MSFKPARISILRLLCAALLTLLCLLWIRTRWHTTILGFFTPSGHLQAIASDRDGLLIFLSEVPFGRESAWSADAMTVSADDFAAAHDAVYDPASARLPGHWHFAGFRYAKDQLTPTPTITWHFRAIMIPYWLLIVLLSILPLQRLQRWVIRRRRVRRGQCPACGYDLRHSADRCPECGSPRKELAVAFSVRPDGYPIPGRTRRLAIICMVCAIVGCVSAAVLLRGRYGVPSTPLQTDPLTKIRLHNKDFGPATVRGVIASIQDTTGVSINPDWPSLDNSTHHESKRMIEFHVQNASLLEAVKSVIASAGFWNRPECRTAGNVVYVAAASRSPVCVRVYPAADLIRQADPMLGLVNDVPLRPQTATEVEEERRLGFVALVADVVYTDDWTDNGGDAGRLLVCGDKCRRSNPKRPGRRSRSLGCHAIRRP